MKSSVFTAYHKALGSVLAIIVLLGILTACGADQTTAQGTAQILLSAMQNSDYSTITSHTKTITNAPDEYVVKNVKPNTPITNTEVGSVISTSDTTADVHISYTIGDKKTSLVWSMEKSDGTWKVPMEQVLPAVGFMNKQDDAGRYRLNGTIADFTDTMWLITPGIYTVTVDNGWNGAVWSQLLNVNEANTKSVHEYTIDQKDHAQSFSLVELYKKNDSLRNIIANTLKANSVCSAIPDALNAQEPLQNYPGSDIPTITSVCTPSFSAFTQLDFTGEQNVAPDADGYFTFTVNATGAGRTVKKWKIFKSSQNSWTDATKWYAKLDGGTQQNTGCVQTSSQNPNYTICATFQQNDVSIAGLTIKVKFTDNSGQITDWGNTVHSLYRDIPVLQN